MAAYFNENDPFTAAWLRELIAAGEIAAGDVDERSIEDVSPRDLDGYDQCHFFAGIGGWSRALRLAGWPDDRPVWTGSCPCQPFSLAGKGKGTADERHLWPAFFHLIEICGPDVVFGEQVAGRDGLAWLDLVQADLEAVGYACGAVPFPAAAVGAPHRRERLYWVADADHAGLEGRRQPGRGRAAQRAAGRVAHVHGDGCEPGREGLAALGYRPAAEPDRGTGGVDHAAGPRRQGRQVEGAERDPRDAARLRLLGEGYRPYQSDRPGPVNGIWRSADWLGCRDGLWRPVESGSSPMADGIPSRVGQLRGYGNAVVAEQAAAFIEAFCVGVAALIPPADSPAPHQMSPFDTEGET